jgi:hypothetical protein
MASTGNIKYSGNSSGGLDFEVQLWAAADKMRGPAAAKLVEADGQRGRNGRGELNDE